jgi:hypothetical protein
MSLSWETASKNASSQNCIWSQSDDLSLPVSPSKRYVLTASGDGDVTVFTMCPPWYRKPVLSDDLLDHTLAVRCLGSLGNCNNGGSTVTGKGPSAERETPKATKPGLPVRSRPRCRKPST